MTIEQVETLFTDIRFQQLKYFQEKTNVFTIVGQTHTEHWHSSFLSWLLDPHSSLGLGHYPVARLINLYLIKNENAEMSLKDVFDMKLDELHFQTELTFSNEDKKKRSIDVYGESDELIFVIENKVRATENMNGTEVGQTKDYRDYVEGKRKSGQRAIYLFVTPDPAQKPYDTSYTQITYQEIYDYVISKCIEHPQVHKDGKYLLEQYANNLRESVHNSPMALVNVGLCNSLYQDYKEWLDEIFDDVEQSASYHEDDRLTCVIYQRYRSVFDEIYLSLSDRKYGRTPKSLLQRKFVSFTDLYRSGKIRNHTEFVMDYDGVRHFAIAEYDEQTGECYMLILDENKQPFKNSKGEQIGYYKAASQAGIDAVNIYRKKRGIDKKIVSLNGTVYWKLNDGTTIKNLIDSM